MNFSDPAVQSALRDWWGSLDDHRAERAGLRRARSVDHLLRANQFGRPLLTRFHMALHAVGFHRKHDNEPLAFVASTLAHVKVDVPSTSFAHQMAASDGGAPAVKEQRLKRLIRMEEPSLLHEQIVRVLHVLDGHVNLVDLATGAYEWHAERRRNIVRRHWARDYYAELLQQDLISLEVQKEYLPSWAMAKAADPEEDTERGEERVGVIRVDPAQLAKSTWRVQAAALVWWAQSRAHFGKELAELRRCRTPSEVRLLKGFHRLLRYVERVGLQSNEYSLALIAGVLAHVKLHRIHDPFAKQLVLPEEYAANPNKKRPKTFDGRPRLSDLRFRRLLQIHDRDKYLLQSLVRAVHQLGRAANVASLANDIYFWGNRVRRNWAEAYYGTPSKRKSA